MTSHHSDWWLVLAHASLALVALQLLYVAVAVTLAAPDDSDMRSLLCVLSGLLILESSAAAAVPAVVVPAAVVLLRKALLLLLLLTDLINKGSSGWMPARDTELP